MKPTKEQICTLLDAWIRQRPGLDFGNYCSGWNDAAGRAAYRAEVRSIGKDLQDARQLLRAVELSGITGEELADAFPRAFSGRLSLVEHKGRPALEYCAGQYWPTEYRRAACAVLAAALWAYKREKCMPAPGYIVECLYEDNHGIGTEYIRANVGTYATRADAERYAGTIPAARRPLITEEYNGKSGGDYLRNSFRREFGRGIANRWFN